MAREGHGSLCRKPGSNSNAGRLCYSLKSGNDAGKLVYKLPYANVYVTWEEPNRDLDICAYWTAVPDMKVGWGWSTGGQSKEQGNHYLKWYGDSTRVGGTEHVLPRIKPTWESSESRTLRIHLNYYGESVTGTCSVKVTSSDGTDGVGLDGARCGTRDRSMADVMDPYVDILFDKEGNAVSIVQG